MDLYGKALCSSTKPVPVYLITDPYAPGAIASMYDAISTSSEFAGSVNMSYDFVFTNYAIKFYNSSSVGKTQALGEYLMCASRQPSRLAAFLANLSIIYLGTPIDSSVLGEVEAGAKMNESSFNACLSNATSTLNSQAALAHLYGITSTPEFVVDCKYAAIPQTVGYAINYTLKSLKS